MPRASVSEADWTEAVISLAKWHHWKVAHFRPALDRGRWRTAMSGDPGFPDLVLARAGVVLFVELKTDVGRLSLTQHEWCEAVGSVHVWRPRDIELVKETLR